MADEFREKETGVGRQANQERGGGWMDAGEGKAREDITFRNRRGGRTTMSRDVGGPTYQGLGVSKPYRPNEEE